MSKRTTVLGFVLVGLLSAGVLTYSLLGRAVRVDKYSTCKQPPRIYPDYCETVIPPNIAPLNFMVKEKGSYYFVKIYSGKGRAIEVSSRSPKISIPIGLWHKLLDANRGSDLHFDVFVRTDNNVWTRFGTIANKIANEDVDNYLVYRKMNPTRLMIRGRTGIYQRNLSNFDEKMVLNNHNPTSVCANCHTFCKNSTDKMLIGVRPVKGDQVTLYIENGKAKKIATSFGYTSWHPSGKLAVYSVINIPMFFHTVRNEIRDTANLKTALAYFLTDSKTLKTSPEISKEDRLEIWPAWSADGRYLYFCSAQTPVTYKDDVPPEGYTKLKYDLVRISYDLEQDKWGKVETVLSAQDTGLSIAMPRVSPDGRWLTFCMCEYEFFPTWQEGSDIYIMDLKAAEETGKYEYRKLDLNSDRSESWPGWSSNSRWIVFSSKRDKDGVFTRSYIGYIDENGKAYKPLVLPQKDPEFYGYCLEAFNTPEFAIEPIPVTGEALTRIIRGTEEIPVTLPITMATPKGGKVISPNYGDYGMKQE